tara:strand:+ start:50 stop:916 length:867 start_codon:yes stop_codon:yes gene_type:complete
MANPISKAVEVDTFDYDSVNVDLVTIESDMKKGNYGSFTKALTTLDNGKTLVVNKLKTLYPKIKRGTKNPLEVKALSLIEESFIKDKIETEKSFGTYDSVIGYWYLDSEISKKPKWIQVEKVRFDSVNSVENKKAHTVLNLADIPATNNKDGVTLNGIRRFAKGSAFTDVSKWTTLKGTKLLENLEKVQVTLKKERSRAMNDLYNKLENPNNKKASSRINKSSIGESVYETLAKQYKRVRKTEGTDEVTSHSAPEVMALLKEAMEILQPLVTNAVKSEYKKVWLKNDK